eukprot:jgi/Orpsp1_1/1177107/evm.model.c7180000060216.1
MDFKKLLLLCFYIAYVYSLSLKQLNYQMICMVNKERAKVNAPYLAYSSQLANAALKHSKYQASKKKMTHSETGNYSTPMKRIKKAGFKPKACAENVAYNQKTVEKVMKAWMNSSGHKKNILNKSYTHFGAGMQKYYWTQNFATSKSGRPKNVPKCPK